jgi:hypothetical protein
MLKNTQLGLLIAMAFSAMLALVSCGGVGSAPLNEGNLSRVAVSVAPQTMTVATGTTQPFTATVTNTGETSVSWLVNGFPGGVNPADNTSSFGTIDKNGNYTAPPFIPIPSTVTVTAVANADNSATANAAVSINGTPSPVSISPTSASLPVGGVALFTGMVKTSDPAAEWLVEDVLNGNAVVGTISPVPGAPDQILYTAPLVVPGGGQTAQVHVTVQSVANPGETASAVVTISAATVGGAVVTITSPVGTPTVQAGENLQFQASVTGVSDTTVSWDVDAIPGGNSNVGTIATGPHDTALYTAPAQVPTPPTVTVTAVSNAQPSARASIQVSLIAAQPTTVTLTPDVCINTSAVPISTQVNFAAVVKGPQNEDVTWQVNKIPGGSAAVGTIVQVGTTQTAVYTAPANVPTPPIVTVGAVSVADPSASATVPLTITTTAVPKVVISPTSASVTAGTGAVPFTSTVEGAAITGNDYVTAQVWAVNGEVGGDSTIGTVEEDNNQPPVRCQAFGNYDPPGSVPGTNPVSVTAATDDGLTSPGALVTILPPPVFTVTLMPGSSDPQTVQVQPPNNKILYTATQTKNGVVDTTDPLSWTLTSTNQDCSVSNGSICGTITPTGVNNSDQFTATYTAPISIPPNNQVTLTVASEVAPSASDYNVIGIGVPTIAINGPASVQAGTGPFSYTVIITPPSDQSLDVVWQLGCISDWDGVSPDGNCQPTSKDDFKDGPGCIQYGRARVCGAAGDLTVPGENALSYTPPLTVSTTDYEQNSCTPNGDPHASIVPINASIQATGCPQGVCTAIACVTVTPP